MSVTTTSSSDDSKFTRRRDPVTTCVWRYSGKGFHAQRAVRFKVKQSCVTKSAAAPTFEPLVIYYSLPCMESNVAVTQTTVTTLSSLGAIVKFPRASMQRHHIYGSRRCGRGVRCYAPQMGSSWTICTTSCRAVWGNRPCHLHSWSPAQDVHFGQSVTDYCGRMSQITVFIPSFWRAHLQFLPSVLGTVTWSRSPWVRSFTAAGRWFNRSVG